MSNSVPKYSFVAQEGGTGKLVELDIREHTPETHTYLKDVCSKMSQAVRGFHKISNNEPSCPGWVQWDVVSWSQKNYPERHKFGAWSGDVLAGFVWIRHGFPSNCRNGEKLTYVELMAATPTNLPTQIWLRCLEDVGVALLAFVALQSLRNGYNCNFSLHAADENVAEYGFVYKFDSVHKFKILSINSFAR
jgi:hypothetical protein